MSWKNTEERFGSLSIGLHWLVVILIIGVYATIELRGIFPKGSDARELMKHWHFMLGLSVFFLTFVRIGARVIAPNPRIEPDMPGWQHLAAKGTHLALYGLLIGLPLAGWLILSAAGKPIPFFGMELPALIGPNKELAGTIKELHESVATLGYWLIGLHAAAALVHHHLMRDNTLLRMLPQRK